MTPNTVDWDNVKKTDTYGIPIVFMLFWYWTIIDSDVLGEFFIISLNKPSVPKRSGCIISNFILSTKYFAQKEFIQTIPIRILLMANSIKIAFDL